MDGILIMGFLAELETEPIGREAVIVAVGEGGEKLSGTYSRLNRVFHVQ
jgi:hypothetical protein